MRIFDILTSRLHAEQLTLQNDMDRLIQMSINNIVTSDTPTDKIADDIDDLLTRLTVNALKTRTWEGIKSSAEKLRNHQETTQQ